MFLPKQKYIYVYMFEVCLLEIEREQMFQKKKKKQTNKQTNKEHCL